MILLAKELPELRDHLARWADTDQGPVMFKLGVEALDRDITGDALDTAAASVARFDAAVLRDAELFHVSPSMVELLMQAREGIGEAGFMPYDLPAPVGMAYFAVEIETEAPDATLAARCAELSEQIVAAGATEELRAAGIDPLEPLDEKSVRYAAHTYPEHLLCVWRVIPPTDRYEHGSVHLSWWFERDAYWTAHRELGNILGEKTRDWSASPPPGVLPRFLPDGHCTIALHPDAVRVDGPGEHRKARRPDMFRALCYLLRQRIAEESTVMPDRAARRRMAREGREPAPVRVISLRGGSAHGGGDGSRAYVHRWMVRGHWRRQWYPSIGQHRPRWISPFIKGPDDAPLLGGEKVYSVQARSAVHGC